MENDLADPFAFHLSSLDEGGHHTGPCLQLVPEEVDGPDGPLLGSLYDSEMFLYSAGVTGGCQA